MTPTNKALPCPCCGSTNIDSNEWGVDEDHAKQFDADEHSEIWAFECNDCLCSAPVQSWQKRPDPWRPISTAPKTGECFLGHLSSVGVTMEMWWDDLRDRFYSRDGAELPTHWMPIPEVRV